MSSVGGQGESLVPSQHTVSTLKGVLIPRESPTVIKTLKSLGLYITVTSPCETPAYSQPKGIFHTSSDDHPKNGSQFQGKRSVHSNKA